MIERDGARKWAVVAGNAPHPPDADVEAQLEEEKRLNKAISKNLAKVKLP